MPAEFWPHSVTTAAAASAVARRVSARPNDSFGLGLLHDVGTALLVADALVDEVRAARDDLRDFG